MYPVWFVPVTLLAFLKTTNCNRVLKLQRWGVLSWVQHQMARTQNFTVILSVKNTTPYYYQFISDHSSSVEINTDTCSSKTFVKWYLLIKTFRLWDALYEVLTADNGFNLLLQCRSYDLKSLPFQRTRSVSEPGCWWRWRTCSSRFFFYFWLFLTSLKVCLHCSHP